MNTPHNKPLLQAIHDLQAENRGGEVEDAALARALRLELADLRDQLEQAAQNGNLYVKRNLDHSLTTWLSPHGRGLL